MGDESPPKGLKTVKVRSAKELMQENMLVKHYAGSLAYGTNLPTSDVDFRGIFCADPVNVLTPFFPVRESTDVDEEDTKLYELAHFMKLCLDCNPNIVETLWVDDKDIVFRTPAYDLLRENRQRLLSSKLAFTFSGYALSQLKRIKGHNKWINNPQSENPPQPKDFVSMVQNFGKAKVMPGNFHLVKEGYRLVPYGGELYGVYPAEGYETYDVNGKLNTTFEGDRHTLGAPEMLVRFNKDEYRTAKEKHEQYWEWKKNRNVARGELEEKFGYDTKHAMHLVRLLRMGVEALRDGEVVVRRPDAEELLAIRNGAWTYEQVVQYAEQKDREVREVWYKQTSLSKKPDVKFAAELLMQVQETVWKNK